MVPDGIQRRTDTRYVKTIQHTLQDRHASKRLIHLAHLSASFNGSFPNSGVTEGKLTICHGHP